MIENYIPTIEIPVMKEIKETKKTKSSMPNPYNDQKYKPLTTELIQQIQDLRGIDLTNINEQNEIIGLTEKQQICFIYKYKQKNEFCQTINLKAEKHLKYRPELDIKDEDYKSFPILGLNCIDINSKELWIVEGGFDLLAMKQCGFNCISMFNSSPNEKFKELIVTFKEWLDAKKITLNVCLDNDKAGADGMVKINEFLKEHKIKHNIYRTLVEGEDKNDILKRKQIIELSDFKLIEEYDSNKVDILKEFNLRITDSLLNYEHLGFLELDILKIKNRGLMFPIGQMSVIMAGSGVGKSTLLNTLYEYAYETRPDAKLLFVALEEEKNAVILRLLIAFIQRMREDIMKKHNTFLSSEIRLLVSTTLDAHAKGTQTELSLELIKYAEQIQERVHIYKPKKTAKITEILNAIKEMHKHSKYTMICFDYFQLLKADNNLPIFMNTEVCAEALNQFVTDKQFEKTVMIVTSQKVRGTAKDADLSNSRGGEHLSHLSAYALDYSVVTDKDSETTTTLTVLKARDNEDVGAGSKTTNISYFGSYIAHNDNEVLKNNNGQLKSNIHNKRPVIITQEVEVVSRDIQITNPFDNVMEIINVPISKVTTNELETISMTDKEIADIYSDMLESNGEDDKPMTEEEWLEDTRRLINDK
jgi:hypothetical protein